MNLILLQPDDAWSSADQVRLVGRRADHIRQQLLAVHNQLEGMHDLKRAGGAGVSFRSSSWCSKTTDVLAG